MNFGSLALNTYTNEVYIDISGKHHPTIYKIVSTLVLAKYIGVLGVVL